MAGRWISRKFGKSKELPIDVDNNVSTITNSSLALLALAVGIIVDLDRPLKGFINVDQQAMMILKDSLR